MIYVLDVGIGIYLNMVIQLFFFLELQFYTKQVSAGSIIAGVKSETTSGSTRWQDRGGQGTSSSGGIH